MVVEQEQAYNVDQESRTAHNQEEFRIVHFLKFHQSLQRLHQNCETESHQEDGIHQSPQYFRANPAKCVLLRLPFWNLNTKRITRINLS